MSILLIEVDDRVTFIRDGRRHSIVQIAQYTIDRKMREYDCAAKTSRRMIVDTWCLDGRDIVAGETVAILASN